ncbi:hypothetical protein CTM97_18780 [Photobacterium phosphoreum]|uniref:Uncharacterized protein n=2 Tax=Photobacterium phosphoreum TaxID=659 RepID=A0A2T3JTJ3_PHOPO|nr:hypothetical protein [Photobacterium phosphoreum]PSU38635.1 hypothetical protein CTM97_18780 [Photobacterium phosphoreum]PSU52439.1 hypothetical protein C9J18_09880 [Photobacterium phosphoreum]
MKELKEELEHFINCLDLLMKDKLIIKVDDNHPYQTKFSNRDFAEKLLKKYDMDFLPIVNENISNHKVGNLISIRSENNSCSQLNIYQQLSHCISQIIFDSDMSKKDRLLGEFSLCSSLLIKDKYLTRSELETIAKDFNRIFEVKISHFIPIKLDDFLNIVRSNCVINKFDESTNLMIVKSIIKSKTKHCNYH